MKVTTDACLFGAWAAGIIEKQSPEHILDIGTGTGLLGLMIAQKNPRSEIDCIETNPEAAAQAGENAEASPWKNNIRVFHADARAFQYPRRYNIIISNPPFYENELKSSDTRKNIAHHDDGLLLSELMEIIQLHLAEGGKFYLLLPFKRKKEIEESFTQKGFYISRAVYVRQSVHHDYFRILLEGMIKTSESAETAVTELSITGTSKEYTPAFTALLKDYYLNL